MWSSVVGTTCRREKWAGGRTVLSERRKKSRSGSHKVLISVEVFFDFLQH
jgi:hypothetical protein